MRVLFAGPSLYGVTPNLAGIVLRAPAAQGDIAQAVMDGATAIGLIDGAFGEIAAVWHKEILFALSEGVRVLGAASMGALRVAECQDFGMEAVGQIAARYASGALDDDAAVAVHHAPAELGFAPLVDALVDAQATIAELASLGEIVHAEATALETAAAGLFFGDRTPANLVAATALPDERRKAVLAAYVRHHISLKQADALLLVERLRAIPAVRGPRPAWTPVMSPTWARLLEAMRAEADSRSLLTG